VSRRASRRVPCRQTGGSGTIALASARAARPRSRACAAAHEASRPPRRQSRSYRIEHHDSQPRVEIEVCGRSRSRAT
jgi:hypothetical protein